MPAGEGGIVHAVATIPIVSIADPGISDVEDDRVIHDFLDHQK